MESNYRNFLAVAAVAFFFSGLDTYVYYLGTWSFKPIHWMLILMTGLLPAVVRGPRRGIQGIPQHFFGWSLVFLAVTGGWYLLSSQSEIAVRELVIRIQAVLFIVFLAYLFSSPVPSRVMRWAMLAACLMMVGLNVYQSFAPGEFISVTEDRAVGLFVNPNRAGAAMGLGLAMTAGLLRPRLRMAYMLAVGLGIFLTFSRSSILGWLMVVLIFVASDRSHGRPLTFRRVMALVAPLSLLALMVLFGGEILRALDVQVNENVLDRMHFFQTFSLEDDSSLDRRAIARRAWQAFGDHPVIGNGLGASREMGPVGTHNMFLSLMVDHGVIGLLILPFMAWVITRRIPEHAKPTAYAYAAFMMSFSFFSHNVFEDRYFLLTYAGMVVYAHLASLPSSSPSAPTGHHA